MIIIDGKKLSQEILLRVKTEVKKLPFEPVFCDILVGNNKVSAQYVEMKARAAMNVGILFHKANFPASITTEQLVKEIESLNKIKNMCGIILQLPLPTHIETQTALNAVLTEIDVDCLGVIASKKFYEGQNAVGFPTALACMKLINSLNLNLKEKNIIVLGWGNLVGKPVEAMLKFQGLNPTIITSKTENKEILIKEADLLVSGMGKGKYITGEMIKKGAVIIDAGTSESGAGVVGDVDLESVKNVASCVSPVPGGVGPVTVAMLLNNVLTVAKNRANKRN